MGFTRSTIDAGGDIAANHSLATSGDDLDHYTSDFGLNHIVDPRGGGSPRELSSATVPAPTATMADGLSTGLMVLDPSPGLDLVEALPGLECLLVTEDGRRLSSQGMRIEAPV